MGSVRGVGGVGTMRGVGSVGDMASTTAVIGISGKIIGMLG